MFRDLIIGGLQYNVRGEIFGKVTNPFGFES